MSQDLNWFTVDVDGMPAAVKAKYATLQKAQAAAKAAKEDFETSFLLSARKADRIDADVNLAFGYRFGKLAVAKTDKATAVKKDTKPKFSF